MRNALLAFAIWAVSTSCQAQLTIEREIEPFESKIVAHFWAEIENGKLIITAGGYVRFHPTGKKIAKWDEQIVSIPLDGILQDGQSASLRQGDVEIQLSWKVRNNNVEGDVDLYYRGRKVADVSRVKIPIDANGLDVAEEIRGAGREQYDVYLESRKGKRGNSFQRWRLVDLNDNKFMIVNEKTGRALDFRSWGNGTDGCYLEVANQNNRAQQWIRGGNEDDGFTFVNVRGNRALDYQNKGERLHDVYIDKPEFNAFQKWDLIDVGGGLYLIENRKSDKVLDYRSR